MDTEAQRAMCFLRSCPPNLSIPHRLCSLPHPGDSVFLPGGLCPACASPEVPCCGQLHSHQLVPRVARRRFGVCQRSLPAGDGGHPGEAVGAHIGAPVPNTGIPSKQEQPRVLAWAAAWGSTVANQPRLKRVLGLFGGGGLQGLVPREDGRCQRVTKPRDPVKEMPTMPADAAGIRKNVL